MIRRADRAADLETWAAIKNAVQPGEPVTASDLRHDPSGRFLLYADVGCAVVKPSVKRLPAKTVYYGLELLLGDPLLVPMTSEKAVQ